MINGIMIFLSGAIFGMVYVLVYNKIVANSKHKKQIDDYIKQYYTGNASLLINGDPQFPKGWGKSETNRPIVAINTISDKINSNSSNLQT